MALPKSLAGSQTTILEGGEKAAALLLYGVQMESNRPQEFYALMRALNVAAGVIIAGTVRGRGGAKFINVDDLVEEYSTWIRSAFDDVLEEMKEKGG